MSRKKRARINKVTFFRLKAFSHLSIDLSEMNILVGANNAGKSTVLNAFRALNAALGRANARKSELLKGVDDEELPGWNIEPRVIPISLENIHTDYDDVDSYVIFWLSTGAQLQLYFPPATGECRLLIKGAGTVGKTFSGMASLGIHCIPTLGPVEKDEELVQKETVSRGLESHRASRHFRSYWYHFKEGFADFANLLVETWPGIVIEPPERSVTEYNQARLSMFCVEDRIPRELYWVGFGFQVWCQLLTHISAAIRRNEDLLVLDEPETYLHPELQRRLLSILREHDFDVILATHSTEIMTEAHPSELVVIDKKKKRARRLKAPPHVQLALGEIGSIQNIALTQLARTRRLLFVENMGDFRILKWFGEVLGLNDLHAQITPLASEGFSNWIRIREGAWGMKKLMAEDSISIATVLDRDYRCNEEIDFIENELRRETSLARIHRRKEIENYLLDPAPLMRAIERKLEMVATRTNSMPRKLGKPIEDLLLDITHDLLADTLAQTLAEWRRYHKSASPGDAEPVTHKKAFLWVTEMWGQIKTRICIVGGKETLSRLREFLQSNYSITLTEREIVSSFQPEEVAEDLAQTIRMVDIFARDR